MNEPLHPAGGPLRDAFLQSLDAGDGQRMRELASYLGQCANVLPSATCTLLGLPMHSTYGAAARQVLANSTVVPA
jgi:hypothetical protein